MHFDVDSGEARVLVTDPSLRNATFAPDGRTIVYTSGPDDAPSAWVLAPGARPRMVMRDCISHGLDPTGSMLACCDVHGIEYVAAYPSGKRLWSRDLPADEIMRWTAGGQLSYLVSDGAVGNIWFQSLDDSAPVAQTFFTTDSIYDFAWSRDGSSAVISRGGSRRDAVLIRGVRLR